VGVDEEGDLVFDRPSPEEMALHFRRVAGSLTRGALDAWVSVWQELQSGVSEGVLVRPEARSGFMPSCGWPELLERMWELRHHLDTLGRLCGP
jgi:hypothetical protein